MSNVLYRRSGLVLGFVTAVLALLPLDFASAQQPCPGPKRLYRLAGRSTMFYGPVNSPAEVQTLFRERRSEIETLLRQVGFTGNTDDLFRAVSSTSTFEEIDVEQGTELGWMFFNRRSRPSAMTDVCWAATDPFEAYVVQFDSGGTRYRIAVPKVCGNLALLGQSAAPPPVAARVPPPTCALSVNDSCDTLELDIDATGTTAQDVSISIAGPETRQLGPGDASSPLRWRYRNDEREAQFRVTLTGRTPNAPQCTETETIDRDCCEEGPPSITLTASTDSVRVGEEVQVQAQPQVHECAELQSVTIDGVEVSPPYARNLSWTTPGDVTVVARVTDDEGQTAEDSVTIRVRSPRGWTLRAFLAGVRFDDDVTRRTSGTEAFNYIWDSGEGVGVEGEYRFGDRLGLAAGLFYAQFDSLLKYDLPTSWEMDDDSWSTTSLFVGPMFHPLRRDRRLDLFIGPLLHYTDISDLHYDLPSRQVRESFDEDVSWGAQLGFDVGLSSDRRLGLHFGSLWLDVDGDAEDELTGQNDLYSVSISPLTVNVGLFYRFR